MSEYTKTTEWLSSIVCDLYLAQLVKNLPAMWETWVRTLSWEDPLDEGKGHPLQYSDLENSMDCIVHGITKSQTQLSDFHFCFLSNRDN